MKGLRLQWIGFREHRYDIITSLGGGDKLGFPDIVGKDAPLIILVLLTTRGLDFEIGWSGRIGKDFRYHIRPNFTFARNKIVFMNEIAGKIPGALQLENA